MKKILVATDFSAAADNAVHYATDMALALNGSIILLYVYQVPVPPYTELPLPASIDIDTMKEESESKLDASRKTIELKTREQVNVRTMAKLGQFYEGLTEACEELQPYIVIMGSQGTSAAERFMFGGHSVYAMRHLNWPLITVPPDARFGALKKIGLACDFHNVEDTVPVTKINHLLADFKAELHVLNTGQKEQFDPELVFESGVLRNIMHNPRHAYHYITAEDTDEGVIEYAARNNIDLLIVIPKEHSLLEKIFFRSHTKHMVLHSPIPVMALHY